MQLKIGSFFSALPGLGASALSGRIGCDFPFGRWPLVQGVLGNFNRTGRYFFAIPKHNGQTLLQNGYLYSSSVLLLS